MKLLLATLLSVVLSFVLFGASDYKFTTEQELPNRYSTTISKHFFKQKLHYFLTNDTIKIAYKMFHVQNSKATVVIASGRTESMVKYQELIYDLNQNGYSVYILDHRGQGYSGRLLDDKQLGHVNDFFNYVLDLKEFVAKVVVKDKKMILLSHSMGGAVASLYVETYKHDFDGIVLSSPMHQPLIISSYITNLTCKLLEKKSTNLNEYIFGTHSYDETKHDFQTNIFTHSKIRYELVQSIYDKEPQTKIGGPSLGWLSQACKWSRISIENAHEIEIPVLILQAGEEKVVNNKAQKEFCQNVGDRCHLKRFSGAYHEMFIEEDAIREEVLSDVLDFISKI